MCEVPERILTSPGGSSALGDLPFGWPSRAVAEALIAEGFDIVNVSGGMRAWEAADLPIETDDGAPGVVYTRRHAHAQQPASTDVFDPS